MQARNDEIIAIVKHALGPDVAIDVFDDVSGGRGVFSHVIRCAVGEPRGTVAVKLLRSDANGEAAVSGGAADREVLAYGELLPSTPEVSAPELIGVAVDGEGRPALVLEDLTDHRWSDQLDGLDDRDLRSVVAELIRLHTAWAGSPALGTIDVRRSTPAALPHDGIDRGLVALDRWEIEPARRATLEQLAAVRQLAVRAFVDEGAETLCHGDPRGDNVAFGPDGRAVLFDWQQMAIQFGEADLAWLLATSATPQMRQRIEGDLVASYGIARHQSAATTWRRYVLGMVLPGLAVLFLAQRDTDDSRTRRFIATSIDRIALAVDDLDVVGLVSASG